MEQDLSADLGILQSHLDGMLDRVQQNGMILKRLQAFEMRLLGIAALSEMVDFILLETCRLFELDVVTLCLIDPLGEIQACLDADFAKAQDGLFLLQDASMLENCFTLSDKPIMGCYQNESCCRFFSPQAPRPASVIIAPLMRRGRYLGSLNLGSYQADRFNRNMATDFIQHLASVVGVCLENLLNFEALRRTSLADPLTGVNNRRFLEQRLPEEIDRCLRSEESLSCLFLDIDFFKQINDGHGHQAGDRVLAQAANTIKKQLRNNDVLARYGGEEFVAVLSNSDDKKALEIAERIRLTLAETPFLFNSRRITVTISIGVACFRPERHSRLLAGEIAGQLIQSADAALYRAKRNGRNRVELGETVVRADSRE